VHLWVGAEHQLDERLGAVVAVRARVHQVRQRVATQLLGLHAQHEADGVHQVALPAACNIPSSPNPAESSTRRAAGSVKRPSTLQQRLECQRSPRHILQHLLALPRECVLPLPRRVEGRVENPKFYAHAYMARQHGTTNAGRSPQHLSTFGSPPCAAIAAVSRVEQQRVVAVAVVFSARRQPCSRWRREG
jgi:hypothetical protein